MSSSPNSIHASNLDPRKQPRQARAQATVETILEAAARLFAERGYADISTNAVAELAEVSIGSLYQYFPNKEALIAALYQRHHSVLQEAIAQRMGGDFNIFRLESIRSFVTAVVEAHLLEAPLYARFEEIKNSPPFTELFASVPLNAAHDTLKASLEQHQDGLAIADPALSALALTNAVLSSIHLIALRPELEVLKKTVIDEATRLLYGYVHSASLFRLSRP